jgi:glycosyltransferase involved in cell wall biosynthesis
MSLSNETLATVADAPRPLPTVTIAIVVRNAEDVIELTLSSAIGQDYADKTIVVVDGQSTDRTLALIDGFSDNITTIISEPDEGVYDGMNKAARLATGDYIIYMNAGDTFRTTTSLREAMQFSDQWPDILIGSYEYLHEGQSTIINPITTANRVSLLERGDLSTALRDFACHQATIIRTGYLIEHGAYSRKYSLLADQEFLFRAHDRGARVQHTKAIICTYRSGGMSSDIRRSSDEFVRLLSDRKYNRRLVKMHFGVGLKGEIRRALKPVALRLPGIGKIYSDRNMLWQRVRDLESQIDSANEIDGNALSKCGIDSFAQLAAPVGNEKQIFSSHDAIWASPKPNLFEQSQGKLARLHFVTFASGGPSFANTLRRIGKEAKSLNCFESIELFDADSARQRYQGFARIQRIMDANRKGLGFWSWKPFIVAQRLRELNEGDVLFYCDAGSELSRYGLPIFAEMAASAKRHDHLFFRMHQHPELAWTKKEVITYFRNSLKYEVQDIGQIAATTFFIKKTEENVRFCDEWLRLALEDDCALINDDIGPFQGPQFQDHRYDQSILSCLVQLRQKNNVADTNLCCAFRAPRDWQSVMLALELPFFWSHRKTDTDDGSSINYRIELLRMRSYSFLAQSRFGRGDPSFWKQMRQDLTRIYEELAA